MVSTARSMNVTDSSVRPVVLCRHWPNENSNADFVHKLSGMFEDSEYTDDL